jgi:Protein of unknown function (DUF2934)
MPSSKKPGSKTKPESKTASTAPARKTTTPRPASTAGKSASPRGKSASVPAKPAKPAKTPTVAGEKPAALAVGAATDQTASKPGKAAPETAKTAKPAKTKTVGPESHAAVAVVPTTPPTRATRKPPRKSNGGAVSKAVFSPAERHRMIELTAYYIAEKRGFAGGDPDADWLAAEAEVDRLLGGRA